MSSLDIGNKLEEAIHSLFQTEIEAERFFAKQSHCRLFRRKGYYSQDRKAEIVFDVSIEIFLPGSTDYSVLFLIECKNYTHSVPVDDVEEFFAKVQQVGAANTKAVLASTAAFQSGAREYAMSKRMGLLRYFDAQNFKWELSRSPSANARGIGRDAEQHVSDGLERPDFNSEVFDLFLQSPTRLTNSLWDLFDDLIATTTLAPAQVRKFMNRRDRQANSVPFIEKEQLEAIADETLDAISYETGQVSLDTICRHEASRTGLLVESCGGAPGIRSRSPPLGRIQFAPLRSLHPRARTWASLAGAR
jgi:Restriction endonuclease